MLFSTKLYPPPYFLQSLLSPPIIVFILSYPRSLCTGFSVRWDTCSSIFPIISLLVSLPWPGKVAILASNIQGDSIFVKCLSDIIIFGFITVIMLILDGPSTPRSERWFRWRGSSSSRRRWMTNCSADSPRSNTSIWMTSSGLWVFFLIN